MRDVDNSLEEVMDTLYDGAYRVDLNRVINYWNHSAELISGYKKEEVTGSSCKDNILRHIDCNGCQICVNSCPLMATMADGKSREANVFMHHKTGHRIPVSIRCSALRDEDGKIIGGLEVFTNSSATNDLKERIHELEDLAFLDPLTQLPNRRFIDVTMSQRRDELNRYGMPFAVFIADIDLFKNTNDIYGHDIGDKVIRMVGQTLSCNCRSFDMVGRWGGEEYIGILKNIDKQMLTVMVERLRILVAGSFVKHKEKLIQATCSIGAAMADPKSSNEDLLKLADKALYESKNKGRNRITVH